MNHAELMQIYELGAAVTPWSPPHRRSSIVFGFPRRLWLAIIGAGAAVDIGIAGVTLLG
jgi:hypothetical protein